MKNRLFCLIITSSLLFACNNKKKNAVPETASAAEVAETRSELDTKMEELQQLTPYTIEEMRSLLPAELDGDSTALIEAQNNMGTGFAMATYPLSDSSSIEVNVFDCGGVAGAGIYNTQFINQVSDQWEEEDRYKKLIDFNGEKAIMQMDKIRKTGSLGYIAKNRLLVLVIGNNIEADEIKQKARALKFK